jgi:uncharacterized membrane protein
MSKRNAILYCLLVFTAALSASAAAPRALLVEGLWSDTFRLREACSSAGFLPEAAFKSRSPFMNPNDRLFDMPERLDRFDVVVLSNIDAPTLGTNRLAKLRAFVADGGGLVVLGGYWAFSSGGYAGSALEAMLPVTLPAAPDIPRYPAGLTLAPAGTALPPDGFAASPRAFFVQAMEPRPGAEVWLTAGGKPALVAGSFEKGRVAAVALTANGEAPAGALAFWDWPDWPRVLGRAIDWAARKSDSKKGSSDEVRLLAREEILALGMGDAVGEDVVRRALARPTAESADALFEYVSAGGEERKHGLAEAAGALAPFAKPAWAGKLAELAAFSNPDLPGRRAALVLLGATKDPSALPVLQQALNDKDLKNAAIEGMGWSGDGTFVPKLRKVYADAMKAARGGKAAGPLLPEEFGREYAHTAAEAALSLYKLGDEGAVERVTGLYADVRLYWSIFRNAGKRRVRETDPVGVEMAKTIWDRAGRLDATVRKLRRSAGVPESQRAAVVKAALAETRPDAVEWLVLALEQSGDTLAKADWEALKQARSRVFVRLAETRLESRNGVGGPPP